MKKLNQRFKSLIVIDFLSVGLFSGDFYRLLLLYVFKPFVNVTLTVANRANWGIDPQNSEALVLIETGDVYDLEEI